MSVYSFKATIINELYYSYDSYWGVYSFTTHDDIPYIQKEKSGDIHNILSTVKQPEGILAGQVQKLNSGTTYLIRAEVKSHPKYGHQYVPLQVTMEKPTTEEESITFLCSLCTKNQAMKIIRSYPDFVKDVIDGKKDFAVDVANTKLNEIIEKIQENYMISDIMILLSPLGVTYKMIKKITGDIPNPVLLKEILYENPYVLTKIHGLGFKKVDDIALKISPELRTSEKRMKAFIQYLFSETANGDGHTIMPISELRIRSTQDVPEALHHLEKVIEDKSIITKVGSMVGGTTYYQNESAIFNIVKDLGANCNIKPKEGYDIKITEDKLDIVFTEEQRKAIESTTLSDFVIISGSAGTGKSTVIQGVLDMYHDKKIGICALAAKAAQRVREITNFPAVTIHRLLGWKGSEFKYNMSNPLPYDIIIIDEASMINSWLFMKILQAVNIKKTKVIIVFDHAQLPPIGSGNIATDLLDNKDIQINKFTKIHRQAEKSGILLDANMIRVGTNPIKKPEIITRGELEDMHYHFVMGNDKEKKRLDVRVEIVNSFHRAVKKYGLDNVVIILPRKQNAVNSTREINSIIHNQLFDEYVPSVRSGKRRFAAGSRIIQKVNNYDKDVINGEMGYITEVWEQDRKFKVQFSTDKVVKYSFEDTKEIDLAYALTVHSYQGSQSDVVIIGLDFSHYVLLDNCLLYTAITRASKQCKIIAEHNAFTYAIKQNKNRGRKTFLKRIIANDIDPYQLVDEHKSVDNDEVQKTVPESISDNNNTSTEEHENLPNDNGQDKPVDEPKASQTKKLI